MNGAVDPLWCSAQRFGLAAAACVAHGGQEGSRAEVSRLIEYLLPLKYKLYNFPPSVLHLIKRALQGSDDDQGQALHDEVRRRLAFFYGDTETGQAPIHFCIVVAHNILNGMVSPNVLISLCRTVLQGNYEKSRWTEDVLDSCAEDLARPLDTLQSVTATTMDRVAAVSTLSHSLEMLPWWSQVRNALYKHLLCWPLLIYVPSRGSKVAVSVPVGVDVDFEPAGRKGKPFRTLPEDDAIARAWELHLWKSVDTAKELWQKTHKRYGSIRGVVKDAVAVFDFRLALQITGDRLELGEGSAEAYFAQEVFNKLLGGRLALSSVATGEIGRAITVDLPSNFMPNLPRDLVKRDLVQWDPPARRLVWKGIWTGNNWSIWVYRG